MGTRRPSSVPRPRRPSSVVVAVAVTVARFPVFQFGIVESVHI
jgi:hypothetical protein